MRLKMLLILGGFAMMASAEAATQDVRDQAIYDSLNVAETVLPTAYPMTGFQKAVGRLTCVHFTNWVTQEESYSCTLVAKGS